MGPRGVAFGVVSPLEGNEKDVNEENAAGGRVIVNEFVDLSSKREGKDDWIGRLEATSVDEARGPSFLFSIALSKRPKLGKTLSKSSLSETSSLPSSINLRDEERGVHRPNEGVLVLGELLRGVVSPFAVVFSVIDAAAAAVAAAVLSLGTRFKGRWEPEVRRIDDPKAALAEALRLPPGTIGSE
jgi:hypothetical protein